MSYNLLILRRAQRELAGLDSSVRPRVEQTIRTLAGDPRRSGCVKLTGRDGWRIRAGDYRVIYEIDDPRTTVTILHIGHRRDVYR
jgi:mRNA interferase RelE/StbE